ncbi:MAG: TRAP transporter small permease [Geminicoccaceae bacterium]
MIAATIQALALVNQGVATVGRWIATVFIAIMLFIIVIAVFFRYGLNNSLPWPEDVSLMMAIWMTFSVAPIAYRAGTHVALDTLSSRIKGRAAEVLRIATHALIMILLLVMIWESWGFVERGFRIRANTVPVQMGWVYLILPMSFIAMVLVGIELSLRAVVALIRPTHELARQPEVYLGAAPAD